jgi:CBS domain-containing protein
VVDLASAEVRDPLVVRAAVDSATDLGELAHAVSLLPGTAVDLVDAAVPPLRVGALLSAVLDSVLRRLLVLSPLQTEVPASWVVLGSLARREVLPTSDVDTALVWDDPADGAGDPTELAVRMRRAASVVLDDLEKTGLRRCADGANADTARFGRSLGQWQEATASWLRDAGQDSALLLSTMLADSRPITAAHLGNAMTDRLLSAVRTPQFLRALLEYTLSARPPTGFVRDFVVEHSGEHRGQLNLKRGGLRPVTSLGRWAAVVTGEVRGTTPERLRRGAEAGLLSADECASLIGAYEQVYGLLLELEIEALRTSSPVSTYIAPSRLDSLTRRHLRESFRAIAAVQNRLESNWQGRIPGT